MVSYSMNPMDLFELNNLFESGNMTQVQVSLLILAEKARGYRVACTLASHTQRSRSTTSMTPL